MSDSFGGGQGVAAVAGPGMAGMSLDDDNNHNGLLLLGAAHTTNGHHHGHGLGNGTCVAYVVSVVARGRRNTIHFFFPSSVSISDYGMYVLTWL